MANQAPNIDIVKKIKQMRPIDVQKPDLGQLDNPDCKFGGKKYIANEQKPGNTQVDWSEFVTSHSTKSHEKKSTEQQIELSDTLDYTDKRSDKRATDHASVMIENKAEMFDECNSTTASTEQMRVDETETEHVGGPVQVEEGGFNMTIEEQDREDTREEYSKAVENEPRLYLCPYIKQITTMRYKTCIYGTLKDMGWERRLQV
ncbi:uncharacterized protein LOC144346471 [Saccoglossus kowalevskii]